MNMGFIKESGKGIKRWGAFFSALVVSVWVLTSPVQAGETTRKWKINNHITKMQAIPIPGAPGRVIGFYERQGKAVFEDGETASQVLRCTFDMVQGAGPFQGYGLLTYGDGSTTLMKIHGIMNPPEEGKLPTGKGTGKYMGGTGGYEGIQGNMSFTVQILTPVTEGSKGEALVELTATYTLPEK
ncbi:MAG: hypothetical protein KQI78_25855 [Deltaproteobacteria bacterium]|nr:hypothetical protein [Deltaproteobacteria bacterium]